MIHKTNDKIARKLLNVNMFVVPKLRFPAEPVH